MTVSEALHCPGLNPDYTHHLSMSVRAVFHQQYEIEVGSTEILTAVERDGQTPKNPLVDARI